MPKISERLQQGRDLITKREHWTTGVYARDIKFNPVDTKSEQAVCFCSKGALIRVLPFDENTYFTYAYLSLFMNRITEFNDEHTHAEVLDAWDKAIAKAKEDEEEHAKD